MSLGGHRLTRIALALLLAGIATLVVRPVPGLAQTTLPQLPQVFLDTTYASPTGAVINVGAGGDLQAALNASQPGGTIILQAGATYTGNFTLPANAGPGWIYVQSSALASLPPPGTRVGPTNAASMPKIVTPNSSSAIVTGPGASFYRLVGIEVTGTLANQSYTQSNLVAFTTGSNFVVDRSYIHGTPGGAYQQGVLLNNASTAVIDSYISDIHAGDRDTQAIIGWNGRGPFKIVNNYLEAAGENIMFGGADPSVANLVPSDIEIRGNWLRKPLQWWALSSNYVGIHWTVKNLFELKNAQRVLIDGNVLENCWVDPNAAYGQQGANAFVLTTRNQGGGCPWCVVQDVTVTNNIARHIGQGVGISGGEGAGARRFLIQNNLFADVSAATYGPFANGRLFQVIGGIPNLLINHNTGFQDGAIAWTDTALTYTNNISKVGTPTYGVGFVGSTAPAVVDRSVIIGGAASSFPPDNFFPLSLDAVGFVDLLGGNYALSALSPYKGAATDGTDIGVDFNALNSATACALGGACGGDPPPPPPAPTPTTTAVSVSPTSVSFGSVTVGTISAASNVWVTNTGTTGVSVSTLTVSGPFALSSTDCYSTSTWNGIMATGTHCNAYVVFAPLTSGSASGTLTVYAAGSSTTVALSGTGASTTPPPAIAVSVSPTSTTVASGGTQQFIATVTGTTNTAVTWTASLGTISSTGLYTAPTVSANATATVTATSVADATKSANASAAITAPPPPSGSFSLSPTSASFGSVTVGTTSAASNVWVTNTGTTGVSVSSITVSGPFALSSTDCSPTPTWNGVLAPGTHCNAYVVFAPATSGSATGTLTVTAAGSSKTAALSGTGASTTPSVLSAIAASSITSSSAAIVWTTDQASDSQVEYGLTAAYGTLAPLNTTLVTAHVQTLTGLAAGTLCHYRVRSRDASGALTVSGDFTFTTLAVPVIPNPTNATTPGALRSYATIQSIGVEWDIAGDPNHNATVEVQYRIQGASTWKSALPLVRVDYNGANMLAGSILFLDPNTTYQVKLDLYDPDGGAESRTVTVATRPVPALPTAGGTFNVVPGSGGGDGSAANPFRGISAAQAVAQAGDIFLVHAGSYGGRIVFNKPGTAGNYIVWKGAGDGEALFLGIDIAASHIWLEGLTIRNQAYATFSINAPDDVVLTRSTFVNNHYNIFLQQGGTNWYITDNDITGDVDPASGSFDGEGIELNGSYYASTGHVVAYNRITHVADGISAPYSNVDIYGNDIFDVSDDGIELDPARANIRVWGNRVHMALHNGISFQPQSGAPWYFIRNQLVSFSENPFKFRTVDRFVLVHNTIVNWANIMPCCIDRDDVLKAIGKNNLWISATGGPIWPMDNASLKDWRTDLNYNGFDWGSYSTPFTYGGVGYPDIVSLTAVSGLETRGIRVNKSTCMETFNVPGPPPTTIPPQFMTLKPGCNAIDAGTILANINDGFAGAAPDLGAYEFGQPMPQYGPRPTAPPPPPAIAVYVSPTSTTVASGGTQQFIATVTGTTNTAVTWTASLGTISSTGLYTAPTVSANATATVTATSVADATKSANASAAITAPPPPSGSFSLSPTSASFGSVTVGTTSAASNVWVTNTGTTGVSVSSITVSGPFALSSTDCSPTPTWNGVLAPGTHCNAYVVFAPATSGSATGTLTVTAAGSSKTAALSGTGATTTPPVLSAIAASSITVSSAKITWTTDKASDSQVEYGLTTGYGLVTPLNTSLVTSHSQPLSGLAPNTRYHYRVKSRDAAGNLAVSRDFTFKTKPN